MGKIIGIDLGTTNSVACYIEHGEPRVIINEEGARLTPSIVGFSKDGDRFVGDIAKRQLLMYPENTIHSIKRFMGRRVGEVRSEASKVAYAVVDLGEEKVGVEVGGKAYTPQQISAFILQKVKKSAEDFLGEPVEQAVVTVPAYFDDRQRQATKDAGRIAGLDVLRIINEPTAAALAYTIRRKKAATIAVYDFGGGTFDISILDVDADVAEVRATAGNNHLGGNDIDNRLVDWLASEFKKANGIDISQDRMVRQRLLEAAEKAKMDLSTAMETEIHLPFLTADESGPKHLQTVLSRAAFEFLVEDLLRLTIDECSKALSESRLAPSQINEVIMVGGSSRIPKVQEMVKQLFIGCPLNKSFNPDEVVAVGAAVQAGMLGGSVQDVTLLDVTNFSLGIEVEGRRYARLIPKGSTVPVVRSQMVSTVVDNQKTVKIHVLQGEEQLAKDNISLGDFELTEIQAAPRGVPRVEVTFTIDTDGIVNVAAKDKLTGASQGLTIHSPSGMSQKAIDDARAELEAMEEADDFTREMQDLRNRVEKQLFGLESFLRDSKLSLKKREIFDTEQALKRGRMALVKKADSDALQELSQYLVNYQDHLQQRVDADAVDDVGSISLMSPGE
ncbi:MAG: molecular chaperone DnaK [Deltaproteobacteria bacterium]|nr:molecular chaperone DnaK [Deltaproteobacteria bacterium]